MKFSINTCLLCLEEVSRMGVTDYDTCHLREQFIQQFSPPSKISKPRRSILNFQQQDGESLYDAWERYKGMLCNKIFLHFNIRINVCTRQLIDSQVPLTKKNPNANKELIEEFSKHSREYHNSRDDVKRRNSNGEGVNDGVASIIAKLDTMDQRIAKMGQSIHAI